MLRSALDHYARQQQITARGLAAARRARWGPLARLVAVVALFQQAAAKDAADSVPLMLAEQDIDADMLGVVVPAALAGVASDGRPLASLLDLTRSDTWNGARFDRLVVTQLQDAARGAASVATAATPAVTGYVRMLNPPSCSRCAVLAGRVYRWNSGFQRHPGCDCRHVPTREDVAGDLTTDPRGYFDSLTEAQQDRIFTKAGAQAIRDGADIGQVVNARRGMQTMQQYGRNLLVSTEGTTRHGAASRGRTGRRTSTRLMPESIYEIADDRDDAVRLLKRNGYLR